MDYLHLPSQSALLIPPTAPQCCRCFNRRTVITVKCFPILNLCRAKFFPCCRNLALFPSLQQSRRGRPVLRKEFSKLPAKYSEQCLSPSHIPELSDWANWNFPVWPVDSPPPSLPLQDFLTETEREKYEKTPWPWFFFSGFWYRTKLLIFLVTWRKRGQETSKCRSAPPCL